MENQNSDQEINILEKTYFKISYKNQNYKKLKEYKEWKKLMETKIGKGGKEIICDKDNIIIYKIHKDNDIKIICPICHSDIYNCIFCNKTQNEKSYKCCYRAYYKYCIKDELKEVFSNHRKDEKLEDWTDVFIYEILISFAPSFSAFLILSFFFAIFYSNLKIKDDEDDYDDYNNNFNFYDCCSKIDVVNVIFYGFAYIMSLIYGIFFSILFISFFILSIPFKLYPLTLLFDILFSMIKNM